MSTEYKYKYVKPEERDVTLGSALAGRVGLLWGNAWQLDPTLLVNTQQQSWSRSPILTPGVEDLIQLHRRRIIPSSVYKSYMAENGYSNAFADTLFESRELLLSPGDYVSLWRRGIIDSTLLDRLLAMHGYNEDDAKRVIQAMDYLPGVQDLILFAVREVFTPDIAAKYGLYEDFPEQFSREAKKLGLNPEVAKQYWAAHWQLPSLTMGYEMYHRDIISKDQLSELLRSQDVMPFWRDKLIELSHNPLTRVDVRRMYGFGVIDRDRVFKSYKDLGYDDDNAELMTEFTTRYEEDETQGITRATITKAYISGIIDDAELVELYNQMGYADQVVELYYQQAKYDKLLKELETVSADLEARFLAGSITIDFARDFLQDMEAPTNFVGSFTARLRRREVSLRKSPSKSDLDRWLQERFINETEYSQRLRRMGYEDEDILLYIRDHAHDGEEIEVKRLPATTYIRFYKKGILTERKTRDQLTSIGLRSEDIDLLIKEAKIA